MRERVKKYLYVIISLLLVLSVFGGELSARDAQAKTVNRVFKGRNNWLFYNAQGDGTTIYDYKGINHYSKFNLRRVENNLKTAKRAVKKRGAEFAVLFAPNKETIYSMYMPKSIKRKTTYSRYDQLRDYLNKSGAIKVICPKKQLLKYRKKYQLYYPNDNHWNVKGRYIGVQEMLKITDGEDEVTPLSIEDVKFKRIKDRTGDLNILSNGKYKFKSKCFLLKTKIKKQYKSNKKVLIVGDSFGECMSKLAKKFYKKVGFVHIYNFSMKQVKGYDYVIWESVERYQDKYSRINVAAK